MSNRTFSYSNTNLSDIQKGKSFRFSVWNTSTEYFNDDYIQDWVSYKNALYVCLENNINENPDQSSKWTLVVAGQVGPQGSEGPMGTIFTPHVDSQGNLSWTNNGGLKNPETVNIKGAKGDIGKTGKTGSTGKQGEQGIQGKTGIGIGLEFSWDGTKLGVKREDQDEFQYVDLIGSEGKTGAQGKQGLQGIQGIQGIQGEQGERGQSVQLKVIENNLGGYSLASRYEDEEPWNELFNLEQLRGKRGKSIIVERNPTTANIEFRYEDEPSSANRILIYKSEITGPQGQSIARCYVADDGYLYIWLDGEDLPRRAGYVRGDKGFDGREVVLRVDNDKSLGPGEAGTGTHLQWKYAGDEYKLWTNLIQINELFNIALAGLKLEHETVIKNNITYDNLILASYETAYNKDGELVLTNKINNISNLLLPISSEITNVYLDETTNELVIVVNTAEGEKEFRINVINALKAGNGIEINDNVISIKIDTQSQILSDKTPILQVDQYGLRIKGLIDKLVKDFQLNKVLNADQTDSYCLVITADNGTEYKVNLPVELMFTDAKYDIETKKLIFTYLDDPKQLYHTKEVDLIDLFNNVLVGGGLGMTEEGLFYIADKGIVESMLSDELHKLLFDHTKSVLYSEFVELINAQSLLPGFTYIITDYQTIYTTSDNTLLGTDDSLYPSEHWSIKLQAISNNSYDPNAIVINRPYLHIYYTHSHKNVSDKGQILTMCDHLNNVKANYDFVNIRFAITKDKFQEELTGMEFTRDIYYIPTFSIFNGTDFENRYSSDLILNTELHVKDYIIFYLIPDSSQSTLQTLKNISIIGNAILKSPITTGFDKINLRGDFTFAGPISHSELRGTFVGRGEIYACNLNGTLTTNNFTIKMSNCKGKINITNNISDLTINNTNFCVNSELDISNNLANIIKSQENAEKVITDNTIRYIDEDVLTEQIIKF